MTQSYRFSAGLVRFLDIDEVDARGPFRERGSSDDDSGVDRIGEEAL